MAVRWLLLGCGHGAAAVQTGAGALQFWRHSHPAPLLAHRLHARRSDSWPAQRQARLLHRTRRWLARPRWQWVAMLWHRPAAAGAQQLREQAAIGRQAQHRQRQAALAAAPTLTLTHLVGCRLRRAARRGQQRGTRCTASWSVGDGEGRRRPRWDERNSTDGGKVGHELATHCALV